jgi:hypothetical protein
MVLIGILIVIVLLITLYCCFKRWWSRRGDTMSEKKGLKATVDLKNMQLLGSAMKEKVGNPLNSIGRNRNRRNFIG